MKFTVRVKTTKRLSVWRETGKVRKANNGELFRCGGGVASGPSYTDQRIVDSTEEDVVVEREVAVPEWIFAAAERYYGDARSSSSNVALLAKALAHAYYAEHPERVPKEEA